MGSKDKDIILSLQRCIILAIKKIVETNERNIMPCNSDHMNPNNREIDSKLTCECLVYTLTQLNKPVPPDVARAAKEYYGDPSILQESVVTLCKLLTDLPDKRRQKLLFNPENPIAASKLHSWWAEHQEADRVREEKEKKESKRKQLIASAVAKLSPEELAAIRSS